jgi:glycosyltransferase involved in cell wall biosynthesis
MNPAVSVIIPTYNRGSVLAAIDSVLAQREAHFELIVVDDGSTDGSWRQLENLNKRKRGVTRTLQTKHRGVAAARNAGIAIATAPLVAFLDSDDLWAPDKLARQIDFMRLNPRCMLSQTGETWIRNSMRVNPGVRHLKRAGDIFVDSLRTCLISPSASIVRTESLREIGGFDEDLIAAEDYDLWLRILVRHEVGLIEEQLVTRHAGHPDQLSATIPAIDRFRILALLKLLAVDDLSENRRRAVCAVLEEKCAIYAQGLTRRGHWSDSAFILALAAAARETWAIRADQRLVPAIATMRSLLKGIRAECIPMADGVSMDRTQ